MNLRQKAISLLESRFLNDISGNAHTRKEVHMKKYKLKEYGLLWCLKYGAIILAIIAGFGLLNGWILAQG